MPMNQSALEAMNRASADVARENARTLLWRLENALEKVRKQHQIIDSQARTIIELEKTRQHLEVTVGALRAQLMERP